MAAPDTLVAYWSEHRAQLRQSESQRAVLTNYVLVVAAAISGLVVQQRFRIRTLPLSVLVVLIGLYGALAAAKYHERANYHLGPGAGADPGAGAVRGPARQRCPAGSVP